MFCLLEPAHNRVVTHAAARGRPLRLRLRARSRRPRPMPCPVSAAAVFVVAVAAVAAAAPRCMPRLVSPTSRRGIGAADTDTRFGGVAGADAGPGAGTGAGAGARDSGLSQPEIVRDLYQPPARTIDDRTTRFKESC